MSRNIPKRRKQRRNFFYAYQKYSSAFKLYTAWFINIYFVGRRKSLFPDFPLKVMNANWLQSEIVKVTVQISSKESQYFADCSVENPHITLQNYWECIQFLSFISLPLWNLSLHFHHCTQVNTCMVLRSWNALDFLHSFVKQVSNLHFVDLIRRAGEWARWIANITLEKEPNEIEKCVEWLVTMLVPFAVRKFLYIRAMPIYGIFSKKEEKVAKNHRHAPYAFALLHTITLIIIILHKLLCGRQ